MPTSPDTLQARDTERRQTLIDAARECFLQFGFDKTSLEDVAQRAHVSRPLIYRKFKNKEELFAAVYEGLHESRYAAAEAPTASRGSKRERLIRLCELLFVEPWSEIAAAPMASDFHGASARLHPELAAKHDRLRSKHLQSALGNKELSELFLLAARGLQLDRPSGKVLRRRLELLVGQFAPA